MSTFNSISPDKLFRLIGTSAVPTLVDVRENPSRLLPGATPLRYDKIETWAAGLSGPVVTICEHGKDKAAGAAAWLRREGIEAEMLEGGVTAWESAGFPLVDVSKLPPRDGQGRTRWVTRARPKVDRIACPWLVRRFVDPDAVFLFVAPSEVEGVAEQFDAAPFDCEGVFWSHRADKCTFDTMVDELNLVSFDALQRLRIIVRGADTARPELAPQCAGLVAASLGLSRMFSEDDKQLEAGMVLYDAFYRWCRDAVDETHDWVSHVPRAKKLLGAD